MKKRMVKILDKVDPFTINPKIKDVISVVPSWVFNKAASSSALGFITLADKDNP